MAMPAFLAKKFAPLDFSSIVGYPNHVPSFHEWNTYFPRFSENLERRLHQHLKDSHECMEQQGILLEDLQMKLFKLSLEGDSRSWYEMIPRGSIYSLRSFHIAFYQYFKSFYPSNALFEDCCTPLNDEDIPKVEDLDEYDYGAPLQENIYFH